MQDLVAEPLEKRLQELRWYDRVETMTRPGLAFMTLTLKDYTPPQEVPEQFYQARKKLGDEARNLPAGALGPFVNDEYSDVTFALYALKAPGMAPRLLVRQAETIRQRLLHVAGVKKVNILGERPERIFVEFSYPRLVTLGISARDIFTALQGQNTVTPAGSIDASGPQVFVRLDGAYDDLQKIADTPIVAGGRNLKLSDVAEIRRGYEDPATFLIRHQGEPALVLGVVMQEGWNGLDLGEALETETKAIADSLPLGVSLSKVTDQAVNIRQAVDEFMLKFFMALGVVLLVSLISLGWRVGIVVAAAVPLTLAVVFVIMLDTGRMFDRISLGALILALGLLVDDAIIAIEVMVVKMEEGMDRIEAAAYAWSHTAAPMLSGTLVTVVGLMPVGFAQSSAGEYAGNIFWIVGFALIASWVVAVAFTPYLGVKMLPAIEPVEGGHEAIYGTANYRRLRRVIAWSVRRKFLVAGAVVTMLATRRRRHGCREEAVLPDLGPPRAAGRGADAGRQQHRGDRRRRGQGGRLAEAAARSQDRHQLYRPGRASLLLRLQPGAARPLLCQDRHPDARRRGARSAQGAVACADRRGPRTRSAPARHPARVRPLLAIPRGLPRHGARSRGPARHRRPGRGGDARRSEHAPGQPGLGRAVAHRALRSRSGSPAADRPVTRRGGAAAAVPADGRHRHAGPRGHSHRRCGRPQLRPRAPRSRPARRLHPDDPRRAHDSARADRPHRGPDGRAPHEAA